MTTHTLAELADYLGAEYKGDGACAVTAIAPLQEAQEGQISFLDNPLYKKYLETTQASIVILAPEYVEQCPSNALIYQNPYYAYAKIAALFSKVSKAASGIHPSAVVADTSQVHASASIGANAVIGAGAVIAKEVIIGAGCVIGENVKIGEQSRLWANVSVYYDVVIGKRAVIHSGVVIGADGFGIAKDDGVWHRVAQLGSVIIGDDVDIGANATVDRGALGNTIIGNGVKLDNQIQLGHNVQVGDHTAVAGCTGIAGSTKVGKHCIIGGGACISGHIEIADNVTITGMGGVSRSIKKPGLYSSGTRVQLNADWRKNAARFNQLDAMARRLQTVERNMQKVIEKQEEEL